ncbi:MAG: signal peptidase I [Candidatus Nanopelagicales bacterium]
MDLKQQLGIDLKINRKQAQDSILITVKKKNGEISSAAISPQSQIVSPFPEYLTEKSLNKETLKKRHFINVILNILFSILVVILGLFTVSKFLGFADAKVVLSGSMEPSIMIGDVLLIVNDEFREPKLQDVVIYNAKRIDGTKVASFAHRIIDGDSSSGFITKGDANLSPDVQKSNLEDITGVVVFVIPFIGNLLTLTNLLFLVILIVSITITRELLKLFND